MLSKNNFWVIAVIAIISMAFIGCSGNSGNKLVGTWEGDYGMDMTFTSNKVTYEIMGVKYTVPYKIKGDAIVMKYMGGEGEFEFEIEKDDDEEYLTIDFGMMEMEFIRVK